MSSNRLTTRIILRNDSSTQWLANSTQILLKGEVGIEFIYANEGDLIPTKTKIKIGDGKSTWADLPYFGGDECRVTEVEVVKGANHSEAITSAINGSINKGDIAIVKEAIIAEEDLGALTQQYQYTAYVYGEIAEGKSDWKAMDGNYSANNVYFDNDMMVTTNVGYITTKNGQGTIPSKGKNLTEVFESMYVKEQNPSKTDPKVTFDSVTSGRYEVGEKVTPSWDANFNKGSYTYGPDTGLTPTWEISDTMGHTAATEIGSFAEVQITDSTDYKITAKASYGDGTIPVTNKGNEYTTVQIKAGSKSATSNKLYGERKAFYGAFVTPIDLDGTTIRSKCTAKWHDDDVDSNSYCSGDGYTLKIPEGATQVVVALKGKTIKAVHDVNAYGTNIQLNNVFVLQQSAVSIPGANSYTGVDYNVYVYSVPGGLGANTYHISIGV